MEIIDARALLVGAKVRFTKNQEMLEALSMGIETLDKQIPKKPICETVDENENEYEFEHYMCPNCKNILHQRYKKSRELMRYKQNYCHDCGQKLDWD